MKTTVIEYQCHLKANSKPREREILDLNIDVVMEESTCDELEKKKIATRKLLKGSEEEEEDDENIVSRVKIVDSDCPIH
ncbi:hypothetical protein LOK49_LG09G00390 [Camellia lanceoleosa]|uniref:Uncharacterized protein n=1 Tax=Camellia lanceoleosa TaxID=1840588 RepID=A0ACC0GHY4_9ERIC|nr:hypothetical protein LOK49_LG09G00390 [Camellia lanceoleosa]